MNDLILLAKLLKYKKDAQTVDSDIASAYTACEDKGATLPQTQDSANLPDTIESIPTGGGGGDVVENPALRLIDWEGTILKDYSKADALALEALPAPSTLSAYSDIDHEYLLFQEWNWSLANIKTWVQNHSGEALFVGAIYTTTDSQNHKGWDDPRLDNDKLVSYFKKGNGYLNNQQWFNFTSLRAVSLMYKIALFGTQVFQNCSCLKSINIPSETTNIGQNAFANCSNLKFVSLPAELITIGTSAFQYCGRLNSINVPDSVTSIGQSAFQGCGNIRTINIPSGVTIIQPSTFQSCTNLESIIIPNGVTTIGDNAFTDCKYLKTINIPPTVTSIGRNAFSDCINLLSINIPDGVVSMQQYVLNDCYTLLSLDIPSTVTTIYQYAFANCYSLKDIILRGKPSLTHTTAFNQNPNTQKIYVPRANLSWFETATNWSTMYSKFVAIEDNIEYLESLGYNVDAYKEVTP